MSSGSAVCRCIGRRIFFKTCFQVLLLHTAQYAGRTESICHFTKNTSLALLLLIIGWNDSRFIMGVGGVVPPSTSHNSTLWSGRSKLVQYSKYLYATCNPKSIALSRSYICNIFQFLGCSNTSGLSFF